MNWKNLFHSKRAARKREMKLSEQECISNMKKIIDIQFQILDYQHKNNVAVGYNNATFGFKPEGLGTPDYNLYNPYSRQIIDSNDNIDVL